MRFGVVQKFVLTWYFVIFIGLFFPLQAIHPDTVILKNLSRYENVKTIIQGDYINILFKDGDLISLHKKEVKQFFPVHVDWSTTNIEKKIEELKKNLMQRDLLQLKRGVLWRSLLLPGWGNLYADKTLEGYSYLTSFSIMALYSRNRYLETMHAKHTYYSTSISLLPLMFADRPAPEKAAFLNYKLRERYFARAKKYNRSLDILALLYCVQFFHSVYIAKNLEEADLNTEISWKEVIFASVFSDNFSQDMKNNGYSLHNNGTVQLGVRFSF